MPSPRGLSSVSRLWWLVLELPAEIFAVIFGRGEDEIVAVIDPAVRWGF